MPSRSLLFQKSLAQGHVYHVQQTTEKFILDTAFQVIFGETE